MLRIPDYILEDYKEVRYEHYYVVTLMEKIRDLYRDKSWINIHFDTHSLGFDVSIIVAFDVEQKEVMIAAASSNYIETYLDDIVPGLHAFAIRANRKLVKGQPIQDYIRRHYISIPVSYGCCS